MKTNHLHEMWGGPDNSRLVSKQFSFRLPVHIAAKLTALGEIYPNKNRTQIVADLLTAALDDLERNLPMSKGEESSGPDGDTYYKVEGTRRTFHDLANRSYAKLEKELGNDSPDPLFNDYYESEENFK